MAGLLLAVALSPGHPAAAPVEIGTFLSRPARSASAFLGNVRGDRVLQQRYGKHLGVPWRQVPDYLAKRLKAGAIRKSATFTIYNVTRDGSIFPTMQRLAAGTRVYRIAGSPHFFTQRGEPARPFFTPVLRRVIPAPARPAGPPPAPVVQMHPIQVPSE